ncbi:helix-turn-helix domain-containing protein [Heyndrickxia sporothermodurans]|uniref:helix-turn-helix domain-containing protein n=1 Tax=Heyndrickxia sporothermodurans TaxID=46224 RepID=UPI00082560AC
MILRIFRNKKHLTQKEVANKLKISVRQYQRIESGRSFPSKSTLLLLEDMFNTPHRVLLAKSFEEIPDFLKRYLPKL